MLIKIGVKAERTIEIKKIKLEDGVEICLSNLISVLDYSNSTNYSYTITSVNGRNPEKEDIKDWKWQELTGVEITCEGREGSFDASEIDGLDITYIQIDGYYMIPQHLYRYQHTTLPIKGVNTVLTKYEYEEIAEVIRGNDQKGYAHNALENYDGISENTKQLLKADPGFPEAFDKNIFECITAQNEAAAIDMYLDENENFGTEISADFISNKGTENEIVQEVRLPEKVIDHLIDDIREKNTGTDIDKINLPVIYDEWGDEIELQYVDEIIKD